MMIHKYNNFILESKISNSILENALYATPDFLEKIKSISISSDNEIAELIYDLFDDQINLDKDLPQNYIDITPEEDMISFATDKKANKYFDDNGIDLDYDSLDGAFSMPGRQSLKVGRFVRALFSKETIKWLSRSNYIESDWKLTDKAVEDFVNLYKSSKDDSEIRFKLVSGKDIKKWYSIDNYASEKGQLGSSCMAGEECQDYFSIYTNNPQCQLLIYTNANNKLLGRALVWKISTSPCDAKYFMDRVYTANDHDVNKFINYAVANGWLYKWKMSFGDSPFLMYNRKPLFGKIIVKLDKVKFDKYPFIDTLCYINKDDKTISNGGSKACIIATDTDGEADECFQCDSKGYKKVCPACKGEGGFDDGSVSIDSNWKECDECNGNGKKKSGNIKVECESCVGIIENYRKNIKENIHPYYKAFEEFAEKEKSEN